MGFLSKIFGTYSEKEIKRIMPIVAQIEALSATYAKLSEAELRGKTLEFRQRLDKGETLDQLLPEAFATVREASKRVLGLYHYQVQLIGGIILHQGRIAEMKTGEGKTLVATLPVYLNALSGRGVHVVTVNDYLAKRDSEWMGKVYRYLGMEVGLIVNGLTSPERQKAYGADITYGTNNEYGFDYLRDNMVTTIDECVQRELNFAIVDEVDSILIDEARTPLIISGQGDESSELYERADRLVTGLKSRKFVETDNSLSFEEREAQEGDADYIIDEKARTTVLTRRGIQKAESYFGIENLSDQENYKINHHINNAMQAHGIMHRDQNYVIRDDEVVIVDDFTGRLMEGRRYSNGLHQAIEAKERVHVQHESKTLATITFQNFFRLYKKLSGMTGTALTEEDEFREIYKLDVVEIPTNSNIVREDLADAVYKTQTGKYRQLIEEVIRVHAIGQPVLIGTISVEKSEFLSKLFTRAGIPHNVLNAKQHDREAEIVAQAGRYGAVTISTNMAGRGTDIILGGNPEFLAKQAMRKEGILEELIEQADAYNESTDELILSARERFRTLKTAFAKETGAERDKVLAAGGLYIIGTERHESRRIDNQLRGRSGRQGDPGRSKFYLSLEDDLMRLFGGERMEKIFESLGVDEDTEINHSMLSKAIESAQRRVEAQNFSIRKHVLQYDDVMNQQRDLIYRQRREVLEGQNVHHYFEKIIPEEIREIMLDFCSADADSENWDKIALGKKLEDLFGNLPGIVKMQKSKDFLDAEELMTQFGEEAYAKLDERQEELGGAEILQAAERFILLSVVDNYWMDHIDAMDDLRDSIGMRSYGQHDPVVEYKREGYDMFESMTRGIREDSIRLLMRARLTMNEPAPKSHKVLQEGRKEEASALARASRQGNMESASAAAQDKPAPAKRNMNIGRNDPCWCGSGKKYKNCHLNSDQN